jgi:hypothetical protein
MKCNVDADDLSNAIVVDHYSEHHWVTQAVDGATEAERSEAYRMLQERGMSYGDVRRKAFANDYERFRRKIGAIEIPQVCIPRFIKEFVSWVLRRETRRRSVHSVSTQLAGRGPYTSPE